MRSLASFATQTQATTQEDAKAAPGGFALGAADVSRISVKNAEQADSAQPAPVLGCGSGVRGQKLPVVTKLQRQKKTHTKKMRVEQGLEVHAPLFAGLPDGVTDKLRGAVATPGACRSGHLSHSRTGYRHGSQVMPIRPVKGGLHTKYLGDIARELKAAVDLSASGRAVAVRFDLHHPDPDALRRLASSLLGSLSKRVARTQGHPAGYCVAYETGRQAGADHAHVVAFVDGDSYGSGDSLLEWVRAEWAKRGGHAPVVPNPSIRVRCPDDAAEAFHRASYLAKTNTKGGARRSWASSRLKVGDHAGRRTAFWPERMKRPAWALEREAAFVAARREVHPRNWPIPCAGAPVGVAIKTDCFELIRGTQAAPGALPHQEALQATPDTLPHQEALQATPDTLPHQEAIQATPDTLPHQEAAQAAPDAISKHSTTSENPKNDSDICRRSALAHSDPGQRRSHRPRHPRRRRE